MNVVVMMIIGIIIFGLGMGLFFKVSTSGDAMVDDLNNQIKSDIANLECDGDAWVCSPSHKMKNGEVGKFSVFIANRGDQAEVFKINIVGTTSVSTGIVKVEKDGCEATIYFPTFETSIRSGEGAQLPFIVKDLKVNGKCSLVTTVELDAPQSPGHEEKASIIVRIG